MITRSVFGILTGALLLVGCGFDFDVPTGDELVSYLDRLKFGPEWNLQSEEVVESGCEITETCPRAVRVYRVEASEFPSSVSILQQAGLKAESMFQSCIDAPHEGCRALGWDEDVAITILIASEHGSEVEVQVKASETVGAPTDET